MSQQEVIAGVDIGTSKVKVIVATADLEIKDYAEYPCGGISKGRISDFDKTAKAAEQAVALVEKACGNESPDTFVNISGPDLSSEISRGSLTINRFSRRVTEWDLVRVLELARNSTTAVETICAVPRKFFVDGRRVDNPIGSKGQLLEVETVLITAPSDVVQGWHKIMNRAGLSQATITPSVVASAGAVLRPDEKGIAVIDIGAGLTDIALFDECGLCWVKSLPVGGDYITGDIAFGLQLPREEAEMFKLQYGSLADVDLAGVILIPGVESDQNRRVNKKFLSEIINSRLDEIFQLIKKAILESGYSEEIKNGLVFTGGVSKIPGFQSKAVEYLDVPVRLGITKEFKDCLGDPSLSCSIGLVICGAPNTGVIRQEVAEADTDTGPFSGVVRLIKGFF